MEGTTSTPLHSTHFIGQGEQEKQEEQEQEEQEQEEQEEHVPFPRWTCLSSSLSSRASWMPVEAPEGTAALKSPLSVVRSTSTVGLPRLS